MSEYMEKHSVSKLIGSPPGYVGYNDGGRLTESVRRRPYSLLLFDEIEKADPDVFNLLLQVLDDGILTDSGGRRVNFRNTVIIMTSNLGANCDNLGRSIGFFDLPDEANDRTEREKRMRDALKSAFPPEFLNRVDDVIVFSPLDREAIGRILEIMLNELSTRASSKGVELCFDESAKELIIKEGYDPSLGARPLRRALIRLVENRFSEALLSGDIKKGDRVSATERDGEIVFVKE
jgi:ATP-dependent Clp protease ATP-binding subunit ClpC